MKNLTATPGLFPQRGFTLIELMITVAVIAILASIAYPNYTQYVRDARRAEAQSEMLQIQLGLEKWRANNNSYTSTLSNAGFTDTNTYYNYSVTGLTVGSAPTGSLYVIRADAQGAQTSDSGCTGLTLNQNGVKGPSGCWKGNTGS
ncbi:MAG: type IV pilin protein [Thiobacillus sp.]